MSVSYTHLISGVTPGPNCPTKAGATWAMIFLPDWIAPVSYTHLDVYKRQDGGRAGAAEMFFIHTLASGTNIG